MAYPELNRTELEYSNIHILIDCYERDSVLTFYMVGFEGECPKGVANNSVEFPSHKITCVILSS
jgi:hypothetical protein